jgi:hypothetical protein
LSPGYNEGCRNSSAQLISLLVVSATGVIFQARAIAAI